jgi:hypothetical protein
VIKFGVEGGGTKQFYASVISNGETDIDGLTRRIEKISTVSGADIRTVLYSFLSRTGFGMVDVLPDVLSNGEITRIGELGYFRISLSSTGNAKL